MWTYDRRLAIRRLLLTSPLGAAPVFSHHRHLPGRVLRRGWLAGSGAVFASGAVISALIVVGALAVGRSGRVVAPTAGEAGWPV